MIRFSYNRTSSRIRTEYFLAKTVEQKDRDDMAVLSPNNAVPFQETWKTCSYRFNKCLNVARDALPKVAKYGNTKTIHSFPGAAVLYPLASGKPAPPRPMPTISEKTRAHFRPLVVQNTQVLPSHITCEEHPCNCCNVQTHKTKDCPFLGMNDTNHDHKTVWESSAAGGL